MMIMFPGRGLLILGGLYRIGLSLRLLSFPFQNKDCYEGQEVDDLV